MIGRRNNGKKVMKIRTEGRKEGRRERKKGDVVRQSDGQKVGRKKKNAAHGWIEERNEQWKKTRRKKGQVRWTDEMKE